MINIWDTSVGGYDDLNALCAKAWSDSYPLGIGGKYWRELTEREQQGYMAFAQSVMEKYYAELQKEPSLR